MSVRVMKKRPTILMPHWDVRVAMLFTKRNYRLIGMSNIYEKPDMIVYVDGPPVCPIYYGEGRLVSTEMSDLRRDRDDVASFRRLKRTIPKLGIGRGAHLLNMLNGGSSWQLVDGHNLGPHKTTDLINGDIRWLSSAHSNLMLPRSDDDVDIICVADVAKNFTQHDGTQISRKDLSDAMDVEVCYYRHTNSLCFQPDVHAGHEGTITYLETLMHDVLVLGDRSLTCEP